MRRRIITLIASLALLLAGAVPAMAAPGGVPGPPDGHGKKSNDAVVDDADGGEEDEIKLPEWAMAHGKRIKDATGLTYGHLMQCDDEDKASELCADFEFEIPEDVKGASAFAIWYFAENEALVLGL